MQESCFGMQDHDSACRNYVTACKNHGKSMGNQRGLLRARRHSGAARACKTKPFGMLTQHAVHILVAALGPPGARRCPPGQKACSGTQKPCVGMQIMIWHAESMFRHAINHVLVYQAVRLTKPSLVNQAAWFTQRVYQAVQLTKCYAYPTVYQHRSFSLAIVSH